MITNNIQSQNSFRRERPEKSKNRFSGISI
jgi:hypothetical protein